MNEATSHHAEPSAEDGALVARGGMCDANGATSAQRRRRSDRGRPFGPASADDLAARATGTTFVAIAEIDRMLPLRARIGYNRANQLMSTIAERVAAAAGGIVIGRVNRTSIEFAFAAADPAAAALLIERIGGAIAQPIHIEGLDLTLTVTIGAVALIDNAIQDASVDVAAAAVEEAHRLHQRFHIAETDLNCGRINDLALLRDMPSAMQSGALTVYYQPKLRLKTNRIDAAEALIRWDHPSIGKVPIEPFIRLAEETGMIRRLTEWVLARAVLDRAILKAAGHELTIWVNMSGQLLPDDAFTKRALDLLAGGADGIGLEITETAVIDHPERAIANLEAFAAAGVKVAIDDYGSGLSSLAYLKQLPANELKIDRLFIKELVDSHRDPLLVRSSIDLAHALDMEVTAEGVDDPMALALLRIMGCDLVQGFLVSPALTVNDLRGFLVNDADMRAIEDRATSGWRDRTSDRRQKES